MQNHLRLHFDHCFHPALHLDHFQPRMKDRTKGRASDIGKAHNDKAARRSALVVDDVADVTEMLAALLTCAGYRVVTAASAKAALTAAQQQQFDVIISDIGMPEMSGYELAEALRKLPDYKSIPLVAVTGFARFDDQQRSINAGFDVHMTKPIDPGELLDLIDQL